jgi:hypothetical protein
MNASRAFSTGGSDDSFTGAIVQFPSCTSRACDALNSSIAQKIGSHRSESGHDTLARCAELTTSTA